MFDVEDAVKQQDTVNKTNRKYITTGPTFDPRTHRTSPPVGPASLRSNCSWRTSLIDWGIGSAQPCSSFSTGWCCSHTLSCHPEARSARCRIRWRCPWAGQIPAASGAGLSRAAPHKDFLSPSSPPPCMWQTGTAGKSKTRQRCNNQIPDESERNGKQVFTSWKNPTRIAGCASFPWPLFWKSKKEASQLLYKLKAKRFQRVLIAVVYSLLIVLSWHGPAWGKSENTERCTNKITMIHSLYGSIRKEGSCVYLCSMSHIIQMNHRNSNTRAEPQFVFMFRYLLFYSDSGVLKWTHVCVPAYA